jgi:dUTP pyrophosphatase
MATLYIFTDNINLRQMLFNAVDRYRPTDSGFDVPMLHEEVNRNQLLHSFNLHIKVASTLENRPMPCLLLPRSSISNTPYRLANSIGLIDMGYRGDVQARVDVLDRPNADLVIAPGTRLFQICRPNFMPWDRIVIVQFENELPQAPDNRGIGGFGSTGN